MLHDPVTALAYARAVHAEKLALARTAHLVAAHRRARRLARRPGPGMVTLRARHFAEPPRWTSRRAS